LKLAFNIILLILICSSASGQQFYIRGEVKDESGNPLQNVNILHHSSGYLYRSGSYGSFGIVTGRHIDTLTFSFDGFQKQRLAVSADNFVTVQLKRLPVVSSNPQKDKLASLTMNLGRETQRQWFVGDESYASLIENRFINAEKYPTTSMSLSIDRASYSNIRRFLNMNTMVPPDAVRIEEMLNYFNVNYTEPKDGDMFSVNTLLTSCPWNPSNQLFFINASSKRINLDTLPPSNFVFLVDISGSMDMPNRLPLLKSAFRLLVNNLRAKDTVSLVVYGGTVGVMLQPTGGNEKEKIMKAIDELTPGGSTPGESGIRWAYTLARNHFIKGGNNRVILATDGDFNVGSKTETELEELISQHRESGIYLTCIGVGMGNYKDSKIQTLAKKGNGNYAYFDSYKEAEKILLTEFTQTLYAVADDVHFSIRFNPDLVKQYRLIGFDNKVGAIADSLSTIEGGEIGSAYSVMVVFELEPTLINTDSIHDEGNREKLSELSLHYKLPNTPGDRTFTYFAPFRFKNFEETEKCYRFSTAVVMFGSLLRGSPYAKNISWQDVIAIAMESAYPEDVSQQEFIGMVQQARIMYSKQKKKKKDAGSTGH
jgi:Ca-activated chloride channel homolog